VEVGLDLTVERVYAHPAVRDNAGRVSLRRGPIVYCLEEADHPDVGITQIRLPRDAQWDAQYAGDLLGGVVVLQTTAAADGAQDWDGLLYRTEPRALPGSRSRRFLISPGIIARRARCSSGSARALNRRRGDGGRALPQPLSQQATPRGGTTRLPMRKRPGSAHGAVKQHFLGNS
jgi:hypothetical protein